jgi:hypothetical protein
MLLTFGFTRSDLNFEGVEDVAVAAPTAALRPLLVLACVQHVRPGATAFDRTAHLSSASWTEGCAQRSDLPGLCAPRPAVRRSQGHAPVGRARCAPQLRPSVGGSCFAGEFPSSCSWSQQRLFGFVAFGERAPAQIAAVVRPWAAHADAASGQEQHVTAGGWRAVASTRVAVAQFVGRGGRGHGRHPGHARLDVQLWKRKLHAE